MCYVVRNFLPWKIGESHQKSAPRDKRKRKNTKPYYGRQLQRPSTWSDYSSSRGENHFPKRAAKSVVCFRLSGPLWSEVRPVSNRYPRPDWLPYLAMNADPALPCESYTTSRRGPFQ